MRNVYGVGINRTSPAGLGVLAWLFSLTFSLSTVDAGVVRLEIEHREPFADGHEFGLVGAYERLSGRAMLEVDPDDPSNRAIHDLKLAPRNDRGFVEFSTEFDLLAPVNPKRGNRRIFFEVNNRGNKLAPGAFLDRGGNEFKSLDDAGNGFLFQEGYHLLWCGWNGDVLPGGERLTIDLPITKDASGPIEGRIYAEICVDESSRSEPLAWGNSDPYPVIDPEQAVVTMRPTRDALAEVIPRDRRAFARLDGDQVVPDPRYLYLEEGFRPGWIYEVVYTTQNPRVTGLGFAAVRDVVSFFRNEESPANPLAGAVDGVIAFGISQSGRFLHDFVYQGFNADETGHAVFDGVFAHVPGAGKGMFNGRFVQTTRHGSPHQDRLYLSESFPMTTAPSTDPWTGRTGDTLERARAAGVVPKMVFTNTSAEYWTRAASLLHTDVDGTVDVGHDPNVRIYFIAGGQHGVTTETSRGIYVNLINTLDYRGVLRALLVALDDWATRGVEPPPSRYPRIDDGTLIRADAYRRTFPELPGIALPRTHYVPTRLNFGPRWESEGIIDEVPAVAGQPFLSLVPAPDADGNDRAGIRLPQLAVPVATFTGWNLRSVEAGAAGQLAKFNGSLLPFPGDERQRVAKGDLRLSVQARYPNFAHYLGLYSECLLELESQRFLLDEDVVRLLRAAEASRSSWDVGGGEAPRN
ncbi:alpha/beta hydrolase domain-containing protein [Tautonia rosea]|uniref:alpha/beta hydrolase domain-containing protein n=1 Tax=Tautonia rosea TaxID=2728037 RepID=UPI0014732D11|nr:alpha/beta hydrolase domain-containing protein [Tautonia rosea]